MPEKLPLVANVSVLGCSLKSVIRSRVGSVPVPVNAARPTGSVIEPADGRLIGTIVPGVEMIWGTKPSMKLTSAAIASDGVLDVLVQFADPVKGPMDMEVSVPFAGLNCATDVPAKWLKLINDIVAAGLIVIVKFSVMVPALAAGARTAAPTAAAINPDLTVRM